MRKIFIVSFFLLFTISTQAQDYYVLHVKGVVLDKESGKSISIGDRITGNSEVIFKSTDAKVVVLNKEKGRAILQPKVNTEAESEIAQFVKNMFVPMKKSIRMSTRGEGVIESFSDFKPYFGESTFVVIGDEILIPINKEKLSLDHNQFLVYRYEKDGTRVNKKLHPHHHGLLSIHKDKLYNHKNGVFNHEEPHTVDLYFFDKKKNTSKKLTSFNPVFVSDKQLLSELQYLKTFLVETNEEKPFTKELLTDEYYDYIVGTYGKINQSYFEKWLEKETELLELL